MKPITTIVFSCLISLSLKAWDSNLYSLSGIDGDKKLTITIDKVCLKNQNNTSFSGPYQLSVKVFKAILNQNNGTIEFVKKARVRDSVAAFDDYEFDHQSGEVEATDLLMTALTGMSTVAQQSFEFENFNYSLPMYKVNDAINRVPHFNETGFFDRLVYEPEYLANKHIFVGLEISVIDKFSGFNMARSKIALAEPSRLAGVSLVDDLHLEENAKIHKLWPNVAVLFSSQRTFYSLNNQHSGRPTEVCQNDDYIEFSLEVNE
jgi:hypothetical protein